MPVTSPPRRQPTPLPAVPTPAPGPAPDAPPTRAAARDEASYLWNSVPALRVVTVSLAALAVAALAWLLIARPFDGKSTQITAGAGPVSSSPAQLAALSVQLGHPIYWAGVVPGTTVETTLTAEGMVFVRYLPAGVPLGDPTPLYLTVATYPDVNAYRDLRNYARETHAITRPVQGGGFAMVVRGSPRSVYLAYPGQHVQVEVYDPHRSHSLSMIGSGAIAPVR